jgi:phosphatidylglycerophosphate synthase
MEIGAHIKNKIAEVLHRLGISANFLTLIGLVLAGCSGWFAFQGQLFLAGVALFASGLVDMMDGAVARISKTESVFGGILDSSMDRYGDGFVFSGIILHFTQQGRVEAAILTMSAWLAAFLISYVRARAECELDSCRVGFWERGERIGVLVLGFLTGHIGMSVLILGTAAHWTVFQRLSMAHFSTHATAAQKNHPPFYLHAGKRSEPVYYAKVAFIVGLLLWAQL